MKVALVYACDFGPHVVQRFRAAQASDADAKDDDVWCGLRAASFAARRPEVLNLRIRTRFYRCAGMPRND